MSPSAVPVVRRRRRRASFAHAAARGISESEKNIINKMINKLTIKEITEIISHNKEISKKEIYSYCLKLKNEI